MCEKVFSKKQHILTNNECLDLKKGNNIGKEGVKAICEALKTNNALTLLDFAGGYRSVTDKGIENDSLKVFLKQAIKLIQKEQQ